MGEKKKSLTFGTFTLSRQRMGLACISSTFVETVGLHCVLFAEEQRLSNLFFDQQLITAAENVASR